MVGQWQQAVALGVAPTLVPSLQPEPEAASLCFFIQLLFLFYTRHSHAPREADSWCSRKAAAPHLDWVDASCLAHISALGNKIAVFSFLLSHASSTANSHGMVGSIMSRLAAVELHHDVCAKACVDDVAWELELLTKIHSHVVPLDMAQLFNLMRCGAGLHSGWGRGDSTLLGHAIGAFREQGNVLYVTLTKN